jgi:hypothetical protein
MDAITFLDEVKSFFVLYFPSFILVEPNDRTIRYLFYRNFRKVGLSIVILTPIRIEKETIKFIPASAKKIAIELRVTKTKRTVVALVGTEIHNEWKEILKEKIEALIDLIREIKQCDKCGEFMVPRVSKQKKTGTWFVSLHCRKCSEYRCTTYGIGLKTKLHKFIQRKRT